MIDAWNAGSITDQQTFAGVLQYDVVTLTAMVNAVENGTPDEIASFDNLLGIVPGGGGPPGPPGPPGVDAPPLTLEGMVVAFEAGASAEQDKFRADIVDVPTFVQVFNQLGIPLVWQAIKQWIANCPWSFTVAIQWHFETGVNSIHLEYVAPCSFTLVGDVYLGNPGGGTGGVTVKFDTGEVQSLTCDTTAGAVDRFYSVAFPYPDGYASQTVEFFQGLVQKLDQLLRCCPPCSYQEPVLAGEISGYGKIEISPNYFDSIQFHVLEQGDPYINQTGEPNFGQFGKFTWRDEGAEQLDCEYLNYDLQLLRAPSGTCHGFSFILAAGTRLAWHGVIRDGSSYHYGLQ
jgi:hypothetical protein